MKHNEEIQELFGRVEELKSRLQTLEHKDQLTEILRALKDDISNEVYTKMVTNEIVSKAVYAVIKELKKEGIGVA